MSLEAWGDGGGGHELSERDEERIIERAVERALDPAWDGAPIVLPPGVPETELTADLLDSRDGCFIVQVGYGGQVKEIAVDADILAPSEPDW